MSEKNKKAAQVDVPTMLRRFVVSAGGHISVATATGSGSGSGGSCAVGSTAAPVSLNLARTSRPVTCAMHGVYVSAWLCDGIWLTAVLVVFSLADLMGYFRLGVSSVNMYSHMCLCMYVLCAGFQFPGTYLTTDGPPCLSTGPFHLLLDLRGNRFVGIVVLAECFFQGRLLGSDFPICHLESHDSLCGFGLRFAGPSPSRR